VADPASPATLIWNRRRTAVLTAVCVVLLAAGALLFPARHGEGSRAKLVVLDPSCLPAREEGVYKPLAEYVGDLQHRSLELQVVRTREHFRAALAEEPEFVVCPDGVGLGVDGERYLPLVTGRRPAPRNLRPRGVLLFRKSAGQVAVPWRSCPDRTIIGDSLSLTGTGAWRRHNPAAAPSTGEGGPTYGADPYDHAGVLMTLRSGCFDYAVVRQWDAERFFAAGLLTESAWGREVLTPPAPDLLILVSRRVPASQRLSLGDKLSLLGREGEAAGGAATRLQAGLGAMNLAGFNLMVEPDLDLVRRNFPGHWPPPTP